MGFQPFPNGWFTTSLGHCFTGIDTGIDTRIYWNIFIFQGYWNNIPSYIYIYMNDVRSMDTGTTLHHGWEIPWALNEHETQLMVPFPQVSPLRSATPHAGGPQNEIISPAPEQPSDSRHVVFFQGDTRVTAITAVLQAWFSWVNQAPDVGSTKGPAGFEPNVCWSNF